MKSKNKILWVDDEIDLLRSHVIFLTEKGYVVDTVTNGEDAVEQVREKLYDLIFLDEMMTGMGGLETLSIIKDIRPHVPVVMVTKNEAESLMDEAIGGKIADYLIKPVVPSQMLLVCKKILDKQRISGEYAARDYLQSFNEISRKLFESPDYREWIAIYKKMVVSEMELDMHPDLNLLQTLGDQKRECNNEFSKFVERNYTDWLFDSGGDAPMLSPGVVQNNVLPLLKEEHGPIFLFVLDCLRLDQWFVLEKHLLDLFTIKNEFYYAMLPTATPYARNALFAGLYPSEIEAKYPQYWMNDSEEKSQNKYEKELLMLQLERHHINLRNDLKYIKIIDPDVGRNFEQNVLSYANTQFIAVVVNFLDMIAHGRSDSALLKEIAPNEAAYRSLTNSWFTHSSLLSTMRSIAKIPGAKIVVTTDHGSIRSLRGAKVLGDREASKNLRFKFGRNLKADERQSVFIKNPSDYKLPHVGMAVNYIFAKEDYYFVYPTDYHKYLNYYKDTFQHGGISLEEMILPVATLESKL